MGHTYRQLPVIEHFARSSRMVILAYGQSFKFYSQLYAGSDNVVVQPVSVPFYAGNAQGLDFKATARQNALQGTDHVTVNCVALARAQALIGRPDLVLTDYEPVSAQFAYAVDAPLVTIDQQSKYLVGDFPKQLGGEFYRDEVARLRMFFPSATARYACSFFAVTPKETRETVEIVAPVLSSSVLQMKRNVATASRSLVVYISSQRQFVQPLTELAEVLASRQDCRFHLFVESGETSALAGCQSGNVEVYPHGDPRFASRLAECSGIITTGGHTLLSEAMHLGIPCYVIPLAVYEQQMNACVIDQHGFGLNRPNLDADSLSEFVQDLPRYSRAIAEDTAVLLRGSSAGVIIEELERRFFS
jgi:uncharacterized protein (TIGR00661 family)